MTTTKKNKNIREELQSRLYLIELQKQYPQEVQKLTDEIIKIFEKLVDKKILKYPYYIEALEELKEELKDKK